MNTLIRKMTNKDIPQASKVFYEAFNSVGEEWLLDICTRRIEQYFNTDHCWVAESDGKIVGMLTGKVDNVMYHQELYVDVLAVDPNMHSLGIGGKLLQAAEDHAKQQGLGGMWLSASIALPSFEWYKKLGFKEAKWRTVYKTF